MTVFHENPIRPAEQIIHDFPETPFSVLLAQMQSGKTGTYLYVALECIKRELVDRVVILCGSSDFINNARYIRKSIGGGMRQSGIIAAAGIISLEHMVKRIKDDHNNAELLASGISSISSVDIDIAKVKTNIIYFYCSY